jgi:hypothetical protein
MSGVVREAFRKRGHDAWSCDILPSLIGSPYHITGDVREYLHKGWDLMIGHPPCTFLTNTGAKHLYRKEDKGDGYGHHNWVRWENMRQAADFFYDLWGAPIPRVCIENPVPHRHAKLPRYSQIVHPWQHGHSVNKRTCLWLRGLPPLTPSNVVDKEEVITFPSGKTMGKWYYETSCLPQKERATARSITFKGIADAMAQQWG